MAVDEYGLQVTAKHFCAGVDVKGQTVVRTAPILKYMKGWDVLRVVEYCRKKEWKCEQLK